MRRALVLPCMSLRDRHPWADDPVSPEFERKLWNETNPVWRSARDRLVGDIDNRIRHREAGPYTQAFLLGGAMSTWYLTDGAADCHADLYYWSYNGGQKFNPLAWVEFAASSRSGS